VTTSLKGKVVILTGASSGLGLGLIRQLAERGAFVIAGARSEIDLSDVPEDLRSCVRTTRFDVTVDEQRRALVDLAVEVGGAVDGLVNCAGVNNVVPALSEDVDDFRRLYEVNLTGAFAMSVAVAKQMKVSGSGSIVNISSVAGIATFAAIPQAGYSSSKAALIQLSRALAVQWARYRIRVNAIAPGFFRTDMTEALFDGPLGVDSWIPMRRAGVVGDLAGPLAWLLSDDAAYVTGQLVVVDGGLTLGR
jgi:NAD(P)-dependent dehydrogenase (short-subunit alcohol dehydrogenase family)